MSIFTFHGALATTLQAWDVISQTNTHTPKPTLEAHLVQETSEDFPHSVPYLFFVRFFDLVSAHLFSPSFFSLFFRHLPNEPCCPWIFHSSHLWLEHEVVGDLEAHTCSSSHFPGYREWRVPGKEKKIQVLHAMSEQREEGEGGRLPS